MEKINDWIFSTKAGRFVFIMVFSVIVFGILALTVPVLHFIPMMAGGIIAAILLSVFDNNKKWY